MRKRNNLGAVTIYSEMIKRGVLKPMKGVEIGRARPEQMFDITGDKWHPISLKGDLGSER